MNVLVNGRFLGRRITGVERYAFEIYRRLGDGPRVIRAGNHFMGVNGHLWEQFVLPKYVVDGQILWSPANTGPLLLENQVLTLHDISPLEHPEWFKPAFSLWYRWFIPRLVRKVRRVVVSSRYMRDKLLGRFSLPAERVVVIPGGVDREQFHPAANSSMDLPTKYALFVGTLQARKNIARLLAAWEQVKDTVADAWLVIVGDGGRAFRKMEIEPVARVKSLGRIDDGELPGIYARAALFIMPSLDEGFGLPVLEAMASGTPVLSSSAGALSELVADAGLTFDPLDVSQLAAAIERCFRDADLRAFLREGGLKHARCFSWQIAARDMRQVFEQSS